MLLLTSLAISRTTHETPETSELQKQTVDKSEILITYEKISK